MNTSGVGMAVADEHVLFPGSFIPITSRAVYQ